MVKLPQAINGNDSDLVFNISAEVEAEQEAKVPDKPKPSRRGANPEKMLTAIQAFGKDGASYADWQRKSGVPPSSFSRNYKKLIVAGQVIQTEAPDGSALFIWAKPRTLGELIERAGEGGPVADRGSGLLH